ncbi:MAG: YfiR family protein [Fuerstiella sp.]|jgi:hypothetical protein
MIILLFACAFGREVCSTVFAQQYGTVANPRQGEVVTVVDRTAEYNVKAVYLYNFGRYVEWPAFESMSTNAFHIGVFGQSNLLPPLQKLARYKKVVDKRTGQNFLLN